MTTPAPAGVELVASLDGKSRISVAHDTHARAVERLEALAVDVRSAFGELVRASEQLQACGITTETHLQFPLDEAWASFRVKEFTKKEREGKNP